MNAIRTVTVWAIMYRSREVFRVECADTYTVGGKLWSRSIGRVYASEAEALAAYAAERDAGLA